MPCTHGSTTILHRHADIFEKLAALLKHRKLDGTQIDEIISRAVAARQLAGEHERRKRWQAIIENAATRLARLARTAKLIPEPLMVDLEALILQLDDVQLVGNNIAIHLIEVGYCDAHYAGDAVGFAFALRRRLRRYGRVARPKTSFKVLSVPPAPSCT